MSERILISISLPVSVVYLVQIIRSLEAVPEINPLRTFTRQVGERLEIYEVVEPKQTKTP